MRASHETVTRFDRRKKFYEYESDAKIRRRETTNDKIETSSKMKISESIARFRALIEKPLRPYVFR